MNGIVNSFNQYKQEYYDSFNKTPEHVSKIVIFCALAFFHGAAEAVSEQAWCVYDWTRYLITSISSLGYDIVESIFTSIFGGVNQLSSKKNKTIDIKTENYKTFIQEIREGFERTKADIKKLKEGENEVPIVDDLQFAESTVDWLLRSAKEMYRPDDESVKELEMLMNDIIEMKKFPVWISFLDFSAKTPKDEEKGKIESKNIDLVEIKIEESNKIDYKPPRFVNDYNRCYLNSTMQSLLAVPHFRKLIRNFNPDTWKNKCKNEFLICNKKLALSNSENRKTALKEDKDAIILKYKVGTVILKLMKELLDNLEMQKGDCNKIMHKIRKRMFEGVMNPEFKGKKVNDQMDANAAFATFLDLYDQKMSYKMISQRTGDDFYTTVDPITYLPIGMLPDKDETFQEILEREFSDETIDNSPKDGELIINEDITITNKYIDLEGKEPPQMLVIQLKRPYNASSNKKIPLDNFKIDLSKVFNVKDPVDYKLVSVVYRPSGSELGGHYVSRVCYDDQWYYCDDLSSDIKKIKLEEVKPEDGYMFVFERM